MPAAECNFGRLQAATSFKESKCRCDTCALLGKHPDNSTRLLLPLLLLVVVVVAAAAAA
jgi:hypothetical protein